MPCQSNKHTIHSLQTARVRKGNLLVQSEGLTKKGGMGEKREGLLVK